MKATNNFHQEDYLKQIFPDLKFTELYNLLDKLIDYKRTSKTTRTIIESKRYSEKEFKNLVGYLTNDYESNQKLVKKDLLRRKFDEVLVNCCNLEAYPLSFYNRINVQIASLIDLIKLIYEYGKEEERKRMQIDNEKTKILRSKSRKMYRNI